MNQHAQRLMVGTILSAILIACIIALSTLTIVGIFALICLLAVYEWSRLIAVRTNKNKQRLYIFIGVIATLSLASFSIYYDDKIILYVAAIWWFIALLISVFYNIRLCSNTVFGWFLSLHIVIALAACGVAIYILHEIAWSLLLYAMILVIVSDTAAYYIGRSVGKNKLAPTISPGKTKEGFWGALFATLVLSSSTVALLLEDITLLNVVSWIFISLIACIAGVVGDLTESMAKRCAGVKDSGNLLPGHGGLLDRLDAFIAAAPVIALGVISLRF